MRRWRPRFRILTLQVYDGHLDLLKLCDWQRKAITMMFRVPLALQQSRNRMASPTHHHVKGPSI